MLVELLPGVTGMVPKSEFDPAAPPEAGVALQVKVLTVSVGSRRITVSLKVSDDPQAEATSDEAAAPEAAALEAPAPDVDAIVAVESAAPDA